MSSLLHKYEKTLRGTDFVNISANTEDRVNKVEISFLEIAS